MIDDYIQLFSINVKVSFFQLLYRVEVICMYILGFSFNFNLCCFLRLKLLFVALIVM